MNQHETMKKIRANFLASGFLHCTIEEWETAEQHPDARALIGTEIRKAQAIAGRMPQPKPKQGEEPETRDAGTLVVTVELPAGPIRDYYAARYFPIPQ